MRLRFVVGESPQVDVCVAQVVEQSAPDFAGCAGYQYLCAIRHDPAPFLCSCHATRHKAGDLPSLDLILLSSIWSVFAIFGAASSRGGTGRSLPPWVDFSLADL